MQMSAAKCAVHFRWKHLPANELLGSVDYMRAHEVASAHSGFASVVRILQLFYFHEVLYQKNLVYRK